MEVTLLLTLFIVFASPAGCVSGRLTFAKVNNARSYNVIVIRGQILHFRNDHRQYDTIGRIGFRFGLADEIGGRCRLPSHTNPKP